MSAEGVRPLGKYVSTIKEFRAPKTTGELQSFLGLVNFVSKWIPNYATVTEPLKTLLRNKNGDRTNIAELWGLEQQQCFESLKEIMTNISSLGYYDENDRTIVIADASPVALGGVLVQLILKAIPGLLHMVTKL
ncbi:Transposon Tf2-11 polyprotein [Eumeta japonica]|uniref:RNA-directed DNA polymerase n=1 Tax=Eumeta variegata TaxID=151549 RepID=A0A4C1XW79_EUMVA|nr:Transposon Tf2-11 polyprotein [Eumeta japonica]